MKKILFIWVIFFGLNSCKEDDESDCNCEMYFAEEFEKGLEEVSLKPCLLETDYPDKNVPFSFEQAQALSTRHNCSQ